MSMPEDDYEKTLRLFAAAHDEAYPPGWPNRRATAVDTTVEDTARRAVDPAEVDAFAGLPPAPRGLKIALVMGVLCAVFLVGACARTFLG